MIDTKVNKEQIPINFSFISNKSFDNYIVGNDKFIISSLKKLANNTSSSIIFLSGNKSSGKSHLCSALMVISEKSICQLNKSNILEAHLEKILANDLLIIDDIDQIVNSYDIEEKLFSIINDFILNKKNILVTSSEPLNKIKFKLPDLSSRLKSDQVLIIPELTDNDKIKVLQNIAKERGWILSDNVCDYIMRHYKRDLFFLCNCVKSLDVASLSLKKKITIPFIKKIMEYK